MSGEKTMTVSLSPTEFALLLVILTRGQNQAREAWALRLPVRPGERSKVKSEAPAAPWALIPLSPPARREAAATWSFPRPQP